MKEKKIIATFMPQFWGGPKKDSAYPAGNDIKIDVTDRVLKMSAEAIRSISDDSYEADDLVAGRHDHNGPFSVQVKDQVKEFFEGFGINDLNDLTEEGLTDVRNLYGSEKTNTQKCPLCGNDGFRETMKMETVQSGVHVMSDGKVDYDNAGSLETVDGTEEWDSRELKCEKCERTFRLVDGSLKCATKRLILSMSDNNEFYSEVADYAIAELTSERMARIRELAAVVRSLKVYRVSEFIYELDFMVSDYDKDPKNGKVAMKGFEGRTECNTLNVTDNDFFWSGYYKHTSVRWESASVPLSTLDEEGDYDLREEVGAEQEAI